MEVSQVRAKLAVVFAAGAAVALLIVAIVHDMNIGQVRQPFAGFEGTGNAYQKLVSAAGKWWRNSGPGGPSGTG